MKNLTVITLRKTSSISKEGFLFCIHHQIENTQQMVEFFRDKENSAYIERLPATVKKEFKRLCNKYQPSIKDSSNAEELTMDTGQETCSASAFQDESQLNLYEDMDLDLLAEIEGLSVRAYNVCRRVDLNSLKSMIEFYYKNNRKSFLLIRNCGSITNDELTNICIKYGKKPGSISSNSDAITFQITVVDRYLQKINITGTLAQSIKREITNTNKIQIFTILKVLSANDYFFNSKNENEVFRLLFNCYQPLQILTLEQIGSKLSLSRERVRQIREVILRKFHFVFKYLFPETIPTEFFYPYVNLSGKNVISISEENARQINQNEGTSFSSLFITYILSFLYNKELVCLGNISELFGRKSQSPGRVIRHLYLVNRSFSSKFLLNKYLDYLASLVFQRRQEDVFIPFYTILAKFSTKRVNSINAILEVTQSIIVNDLSAYATIQNAGILLLRNSKKSITQQVTEILRNSHKPLHYTEIFEHLLKDGIKVTSEQYIHSLLIREKTIFGLKGAGIYDLRSKKGYFGNIGDVAEQLLKERKNPMKLTEISDIICRELVVSRDSIKQVLFFYENEKRFERDINGQVRLKEWAR